MDVPKSMTMIKILLSLRSGLAVHAKYVCASLESPKLFGVVYSLSPYNLTEAFSERMMSSSKLLYW